ncbi:MAG TPA: hypothetical protein VK097_05855 [Lentibacillus sp.]|uniref:hypothetical protein n=1 Tax=Lentibacillus sp. TaxID=1925746 RepID=UPI002B4AB526|nr:hypothetical protein [Lentibacillus sp.]HLR61952.1 hypothetical protein [Lentibacillus sp.]
MSRKVLFWAGLFVFMMGHLFLVDLFKFNHVVGNEFMAYFFIIVGLFLIGASNLLKQQR